MQVVTVNRVDGKLIDEFDCTLGADATPRQVVKNIIEGLFRPGDRRWEPVAYMPMAWFPGDGGVGHNSPPSEPLTIRFVIGDGHEIEADINLPAILADTLEVVRQDGTVDEGLSRISAALRGLADRIDASLTAAAAQRNA